MYCYGNSFVVSLLCVNVIVIVVVVLVTLVVQIVERVKCVLERQSLGEEELHFMILRVS